jgi:signal transduction histidine kinase
MEGLWERGVGQRWRLSPATADILLTALVTALSLGETFGPPERPHGPLVWSMHGSPTWSAIVLTLLGTLPLVARRRRPLAVLAVIEMAVALYLATGPLYGASSNALGLAVALYTLATRTERRMSLGLAGLIAGINASILLVGIALGRAESWPSLFVVTALAVGSWSLGENVRTRRAYLAQLEERARRLELERGENARRAVEEERARIARELHDVVAHHVSAIAVQAGAAAEIVERNPQRAGEALRFIQETSRQALAEMRAMLNVLRSGDEGNTGEERAPQPTLAQVERLIGQSRAAGLPVTLQIEGTVRSLPEAIDVSAYRIVQEALTNCLKHAGPAQAMVLVRYAVEALELEISDDGRRAAGTPNGAGEGRGLIGMRERVALFGGELVAGPAPGGGFSVQARLPLREA